MSKLRKNISALLITVLIVSMCIVSPNAVEKKSNSSSAEVINNAISVEGQSTIGDMISTEFADAQQNTEQAEAKLYNIINASVADKTVTVEYCAAADCTVIAAIYDENTNQMLASGKATAESENTSVDVELSIDSMPNAFVLRAFIVDSANSPLSDKYESSMYTTEMQELLAKDVNDFDADRVLNLDEDESTNFVVYNDDVTKIDNSNNKNILTSYDESSKTYTFENCTDEMLSLKTGDKFSCDADIENVTIIKVKSINIDGDTVTVTAEDIEMEDVFDYVKIESESSLGDSEIDESSLSAGVTVEEKTVESRNIPSGKLDIDAEGGISKTLKLDSNEAKKEGKHFTVTGEFNLTGSLTLGGSINFELYLTRKHKECSLSITIELGCNLALDMSGEIVWQIAELKKDLLPKMANVKIAFGLKLNGEFEAGLEAKITTVAGFKYEHGKGFSNISSPPACEISMYAEADLFFGFFVKLSGEVINDKIAEVSLTTDVGCQLTASMKNEISTSNSKLYVEHKCSKCLSGTIAPTINITPDLKFLDKKMLSDKISSGYSITVFSKDFYYSFDKKKFSWGNCPDLIYNVPLRVIDENGASVADADVSEYAAMMKTLGTTNSQGYFYCELMGGSNGVYQVWVSSGEKESVLNFVLNGNSADDLLVIENGGLVKINKSKKFIDGYYQVVLGEKGNNDEPPTTEPTEPVPTETAPYILKSGNCGLQGDNVKWELWSTGLLKVFGTGVMYNYTNYSDYWAGVEADYTPWYNDASFINSVSIGEGITTIGCCAFEGLRYNSISFDIPSSVTRIRGRAFKDCKISSIHIPDSVTSIEYAAFKGCQNLTITLPENLTFIEESMFRNCKNLTLTVPASMNYIGDDAFYEATGVAYFKGDSPSIRWGSGCFFYTYMTWYYPAGNSTWDNVNYIIPGIHNYVYTKPYDYANNCPVEANVMSINSCRQINSSNAANAADLSGLVPFEEYLIAVVKSENANDILSPENLLYIAQITADENGCISAEYLNREEFADAVVLNFGPNISNASICIEPIAFDNSEQKVKYSVTYAGKALTENVDFTVSGDTDVNEYGNYSIEFNGIGGYCGKTTVNFSVDLKAGDVSCNGCLDIIDVTLLQLYLADSDDLSYAQLSCADSNKDNTIDVNDVTHIQNICAEII